MYDVVIVGAGPAGLSAALLLGRCRRKVLVCDAGRPRNRVSHAVHGFLSRDGISPAELLRISREQLTQYQTIELRNIEVVDAEQAEDCFSVSLADGEALFSNTTSGDGGCGLFTSNQRHRRVLRQKRVCLPLL
jgi:thioredoxin reductase